MQFTAWNVSQLTMLPQDYQYEWTGMAYQKYWQATKLESLLLHWLPDLHLSVHGMARWRLDNPMAIILVVPVATLGFLLGSGRLNLTGTAESLCRKMEAVLLIALAAKNAILIVEFAS
ncbi:efflux RND transporter permease subunit [Vibrio lentus]|nr:efflux RND transporter permease subunit [Vibrio lentus]